MDIIEATSSGKVKIEPSVKMDPEKRSKSIILNPHLWSLKRTLLQRPRGRPRKNPAPERCGKDRISSQSLKIIKNVEFEFSYKNIFCPLLNLLCPFETFVNLF